jgi:hypothetical protein
VAELDPRDARIAKLEALLEAALERIAQLEEENRQKKTAGMAREILHLEEGLWTFVDVPGVEPTNNFGEQCIRHAVMYAARAPPGPAATLAAASRGGPSPRPCSMSR